ncbi:ubiquinone/menaquinone biosynthesis methyltransferase [bacterium]|nr:ubiquinone/menaquinone biosynthesis methyltransferase [bacterium]
MRPLLGRALEGGTSVGAGGLAVRSHSTRPAATAERLFDRLAVRYDLTNRAMSLGLDARWRAAAAGELALEPGFRVLDICAGTLELSDAILRAEPRATVVALDRAGHMLAAGARKRPLDPGRSALQGCALALPFASGAFDAAAVAFGLRNLPDPLRGLSEARRVLRRGARLAVLEFVHPTGAVAQAAHVVSVRFFVPLVGGLLGGDPAAYRYLARSIEAFRDLAGVEALLEAAGFRVVVSRPLWPRGPAVLVVGEAV